MLGGLPSSLSCEGTLRHAQHGPTKEAPRTSPPDARDVHYLQPASHREVSLHVDWLGLLRW